LGSRAGHLRVCLTHLHRWLAFLCENYLAALDFQRRCESAFMAADTKVMDYQLASLTYLPLGMLTLHGDANFWKSNARPSACSRCRPPGKH